MDCGSGGVPSLCTTLKLRASCLFFQYSRNYSCCPAAAVSLARLGTTRPPHPEPCTARTSSTRVEAGVKQRNTLLHHIWKSRQATTSSRMAKSTARFCPTISWAASWLRSRRTSCDRRRSWATSFRDTKASRAVRGQYIGYGLVNKGHAYHHGQRYESARARCLHRHRCIVILILHNLLGITFLSGMQDVYLFLRDPLPSSRDELCQKASSQGSR